MCFPLVQGGTADLEAQLRMSGQPGLGCLQGKAAEGGFGTSSTDFWMSMFRKTEIVWGIWGVLFVFNSNIILSDPLEALLISLNTEMQVNGVGEVCMAQSQFWKKTNKDQPVLATALTQASREPFQAAVCTGEVWSFKTCCMKNLLCSLQGTNSDWL